MSSAAFYCVADSSYFLGAVGLVNSLRLVGHREPIHLLDCGLAPAQRALLEREAHVHDARAEAPPWLLKLEAPLARPAEVMVLLDTDLVATRSLEPLIARAAETGLVAFCNPIDRFVPEWGGLLDLGPTRREPYLSSAAVLAARSPGLEVFELMAERQARVDFARTHWRRDEPGYAFAFADQDVLNAILASRVPEERIVRLPAELAPTPPFTGLELVDERTLRCAGPGRDAPFLVHHHTVKPWLERTRDGVYSRLLRRLLLAEDAPLRLAPRDVPSHLRPGARAFAERKLINARERLRQRRATRPTRGGARR